MGTVPSNMRRNSSSQFEEGDVAVVGRGIDGGVDLPEGGVRRVGGGVSRSLQSVSFSPRFLSQLASAEIAAITKKTKKDSMLAANILITPVAVEYDAMTQAIQLLFDGGLRM